MRQSSLLEDVPCQHGNADMAFNIRHLYSRLSILELSLHEHGCLFTWDMFQSLWKLLELVGVVTVVFVAIVPSWSFGASRNMAYTGMQCYGHFRDQVG